MNAPKLQIVLAEILGKTIDSVLLCSRPGERSEMFLIFNDGTHYKFFGIEGLHGSRAVDAGGMEEARRSADKRGADVREVTRQHSSRPHPAQATSTRPATF